MNKENVIVILGIIILLCSMDWSTDYNKHDMRQGSLECKQMNGQYLLENNVYICK